MGIARGIVPPDPAPPDVVTGSLNTAESIRTIAQHALRIGPGSWTDALEAMLAVLEDSDPAIKAEGDKWRAERANQQAVAPRGFE